MPLKKSKSAPAKGLPKKRKTPLSKRKTGIPLTGKTKRSIDKKLKAKKPGMRRSASGRKYFERRANRSDKSRVTRL